MKKLTTILCMLMNKNIKFSPNSLVIVSMVLILFGTWMPGLVSTCYAQSAWTQKADMLFPRGWHSSCVVDGKIYALGGLTSTDGLATKTTQVYDPILKIWTYRPDMVYGRASFPACVVDGKIWAFGGASKLWYSSIQSIEEYNPATNKWTHITDMPRVRQGHTASLVDGKIYIIGGGATWRTPIAEVDVYDTLTKTWTTVSPMPTPRMNLTAVVLDDTIYTIGGNEGAKDNETSVPTVQAYHPATDTWKEKASMITPRKYFSASVINEKIYVIGGKKGGHGVYTFTTHVEEYDPKTDTWIGWSKLPAKYLRAHSADTLNNVVYVFGGTINDPPVIVYPTTYAYNPHNELLLLIEKFEVDKSYVKAGIDSVCISAKISDPAGITLIAEIEAPNQTPVDSMQLFDDGTHNDGNAGDRLFANVWPVSYAEERHYYADLIVTRIDADTIIQYLNDRVTFTTISPVEYENHAFTGTDKEPNPGDLIKLELTLKNSSTTATVTNIEAKLISLDTLVNTYNSSRAFGNIAAGENSISDYPYMIYIFEECPVNTQIPIQLDITSDGYKYWSDTISILVKEEWPVNIMDMTDPLTRIYPNPANDILTIETDHKGYHSIKITSLNGQQLYSSQMEGTTHQIDLSSFEKGIYFITIRSKDLVITKKIIKL